MVNHLKVNKKVYIPKKDNFIRMSKKIKNKDFPELRRAEQEVEKAEKEIKKEERVIFHKFQHLKKHHQAIFALVISAGVIFVWRGLWNLIDYLWLVNYPIWSYITGIVIGLIILYLSHKIISELAGG